ncbi:nucleotide sugar dehydrogenase [Candidatus Falkowbacteria bacterium]|nr:nucleotide sugar dehydrogenase [Candidatus Falkowbacteria bacterium]
METGAVKEVLNFINNEKLSNCLVGQNLFASTKDSASESVKAANFFPSHDVVSEKRRIAVIGLGYVGLPLAVEFGKLQPIIGFDIQESRIKELNNYFDRTKELNETELRSAQIKYTSDPSELRTANFIIVAVPTPIDIYKKPDLSPIISASEIIGKNLTKGAIIVFESTVYPGVTENICGPIIEKQSGLKRSVDFKLGYSPERTNPGDKNHTISSVVKIVSGEDQEALNTISETYLTICKGGIYKTKDIKTAEAAKVIENVQRDLNIAIVNELTLIFHKLGIKPKEVFKAAGTKWNFHHYEPGLVGGHCIGVDPFYLTYLAESIGYIPQVILAGRRVNDYMPIYAAELTVKGLIEAGKPVLNSKVLILGLTFKENVCDTRNSKVKDIIKTLKEYGVCVYAHDPMLSIDEVKEFNAIDVQSLDSANNFDAVALCVPHEPFKQLTIERISGFMSGKPVIVDIKGMLNGAEIDNSRFIYKYF